MIYDRWEVKRSDINDLIRAMPERQRKMITCSAHAPELEVLDRRLNADEQVMALTYAGGGLLGDERPGVLAATPTRMFFVIVFLKAVEIRPYPYASLQGWSVDQPLMGGGTYATFRSPDGDVRFNLGHPKEKAYNLAFAKQVGVLIEQAAFA